MDVRLDNATEWSVAARSGRWCGVRNIAFWSSATMNTTRSTSFAIWAIVVVRDLPHPNQPCGAAGPWRRV